MSTTSWTLSKENLHPPGAGKGRSGSSLRDTSTQKCLLDKNSDCSLTSDGEQLYRRPALTPLHGSQSSVTSKSSSWHTKQTFELQQPGFEIFQDEEVTIDSPPHPQTHASNSFTEEYSGSPASRPASSMLSTQFRQLESSFFEPQHHASNQVNTYFATEGSMLASDGENLCCSLLIEEDDENKENIFPYQLPAVSREQRQRPMAGILVDSHTVPFIPLDIQEMVLDEDEREQNEEIFDRMVDDMAQLYQESQFTTNRDRRRWSV